MSNSFLLRYSCCPTSSGACLRLRACGRCVQGQLSHMHPLSLSLMHTKHTHTYTLTAMIRGKLVHLLRQYEQTIAHARGLHALHASRLASTMVPAPACFPRRAPAIVPVFACEGASGLGKMYWMGGVPGMKVPSANPGCSACRQLSSCSMREASCVYSTASVRNPTV
jgi:hypothetical protein